MAFKFWKWDELDPEQTFPPREGTEIEFPAGILWIDRPITTEECDRIKRIYAELFPEGSDD